MPESLTLFDFADPSLVMGERSTTSGPSQALYLMNNPFLIRQAESAANRLRAGTSEDDARIEAAYLRFLARTPTESERNRARDFLGGFLAGKLRFENRRPAGRRLDGLLPGPLRQRRISVSRLKIDHHP